MKIGGMKPFVSGGLAGLSWNYSWEDTPNPDLDAYIAVPVKYAHLIGPNDHLSLLAALPTAARYGEKILSVPSADPWLLEGLDVVQAYYRHWQGLMPVTVEASAVRQIEAKGARGSALFLSGGIDSLSSLRRNADNFPSGHPGRVTHALHVDLAGPRELEDLKGAISDREEMFVHSLGHAATDVGVEVVPVITNVRALDGYDFNRDWMFHSHGTVLSAIAHAFDKAFSRVLLASTYDVPNMSPWGSHPLTDGRLSSSTLMITHHNEQFSRQDKVEMIAGWTAGLASLDVCFQWFDRAAGERNCGRCEKCQRTIAGLMIAGVDVAATGAFSECNLDSATLRPFGLFADDYERESWRDIEEGLRKMGANAAKDVTARLTRDRLARLVDNKYGRPLFSLAKRGYKVRRKLKG